MTERRLLDLIVLVADADQRETLRVLLGQRAPALEIRDIRFEILKHPQRDPDCFGAAEKIIQPYQDVARNALVVFDHEGSGQEDRSATAVAEDLEQRLSNAGWRKRGAAIVIVPELEAWVWSGSPHVDDVLGWGRSGARLRAWLHQNGLWSEGEPKPRSPKESMERALRHVSKHRSSALYGELAGRVSLAGCRDPSFARLLAILRSWFPRDREPEAGD